MKGFCVYMDMERLTKQIEFIVEIDKLKSIYRRAVILDRSRHENDAEHSWHLAMMALILLEHANDKTIDLLRVLKMVLIHDLVEIDAGDTSAYDDKGQEEKHNREKARRIYGILHRNSLVMRWKKGTYLRGKIQNLLR